MSLLSMAVLVGLGYGVAYLVHGRKGVSVSPTTSALIAVGTGLAGWLTHRWQQQPGAQAQPIPGVPGIGTTVPQPTVPTPPPAQVQFHFAQPPTLATVPASALPATTQPGA